MSKPKGRIMRADQVRTGDTVLPPTSEQSRLVLQATTDHDNTELRYTAGVAHMPASTPVRIHRPTRTENHDATALVFSSGS